MKQLEAIDKILPFIIEDSAIRAIFLKGSIARGEMDEYSDVDFYCMVKQEELDCFLKKRVSYMEQYKPLIFCEEVNFVGPQIVGVFDNGLHFDLYTVTYDSLHRTDEIKVLYDPERLLSQYTPEKLSITENDLLGYFNEISFTMLEFEAAYCRNDLVWASRLGSHITGYLSIILRYIYDPNNAQLGLKRLNKKLGKDKHDKLTMAMDLLGPSHLPQGAKILTEITDEVLEELPKEISNKINKIFFHSMAKKVRELK